MSCVIIRYGPYLCHGIIDHRLQKVNGLFNALGQLGYELKAVPVNEYNRLSIEMCDREVFRCDIRNLMFNMPIEDDPVCQRAVQAVEEAKHRMSTDENTPGFSPVVNGARELIPDPPARYSQDASDKSDLRLETQRDSVHRSMSRHLPCRDSSCDEGTKAGKVKIMEDKNTTFSALMPFDEDDTSKLDEHI